MTGRHHPRTEGNFRCRLTENHKNRRDGYDMPPEDIMWNKISKSRQQDIIVITCGLLLILLAIVLVVEGIQALSRNKKVAAAK